MRCAEVRGLLAERVDRSLGAWEDAAVERHLRDCRGCAQEAAAAEMVEGFLVSMGSAAPPAGSVDRIMSTLPERTSWADWWVSFVWPVAAFAAVLAMFVAAASAMVHPDLVVTDPVSALFADDDERSAPPLLAVPRN